jgi:hypothetical protein
MVSDKDDNYDACKTVRSKFKADKILPSGLYLVMAALLISVISRLHILSYFLPTFIDCANFLVSSLEEKT